MNSVSNGRQWVKGVVLAGAGLWMAAASAARDDFVRNQAYEEMQRVAGQVDMLQSNQDDLVSRLSKAEAECAALKGEIAALKGEIAALRGAVAETRAAIDSQRQEIVNELSKQISKIQTASVAAARTAARTESSPARAEMPSAAYDGACYEYSVRSGDSLFLIARAFKTTVAKIKSVNGLRSDSLRIGQKLMIPKE